MSRSIEIADGTYAQLEAVAAIEGTTPDRWLDAHLPDVLPPAEPLVDAGYAEVRDTSDETEPKSLLDLLMRAGLVGGFRSGLGDLAERHSEYFMEGMLEKRRMGTL